MWSILCSISKELFSVEEYVQSILQFDAVLRRFFFKTRNRCFSLKKNGCSWLRYFLFVYSVNRCEITINGIKSYRRSAKMYI